MATATLELARRPPVGRPGPDGSWAGWAPRPGSRPGRIVSLVPAALMLVVGLVGLDRHSVWRDEAASLVAAQRTLPELWTMLGRTESVHALYYTVLHGWLQLGSGEAWSRVPSVLAMALAAGLVAALGARLVSAPVGLVAGLLFVANPSVSFYAQEARSTALVAAAALLATWFLLDAVERRPSWWAAYAVTCAVLVALNLLAVLVPLAHLVTLLWWRLPRRVVGRWAVAGVPGALVAVGLGVAAMRQTYQIGWISPPGLASVRDLAHLGLGPTRTTLVLVALLAVLGALGSRSVFERRLRALAVPLLVLPGAVLLAVSMVQPVLVPRYVFASVAGVALLAGLGVTRLARWGARAVLRATGAAALGPVAGVVVAVLLVAAVGGLGLGAQRLERTPGSRPDDLAGAAAVVAAGARPGDAVLFLPDNRRLVALAYPAAFAGTRDLGLAADPVATGTLTGRSRPVPAVLPDLAAADRVWAVGRPGLELLPEEGGSRAELDRLRRDFVPAERSGAHGVGVTLFVRRTAAP